MHWPAPIELSGEHVTLVPLSLTHEAGLRDAANDGNLPELWYTAVPKPDAMKAEIERRLSLANMRPFTVMQGGKPVGMTTYMNIDATTKRLEIGSTWYARSVQRTALNTQAKLLLLTHAFEALDCVAAEFRTHFMNFQSREAILKLGAKQDGILRNHIRTANGQLRDTVVFSIIAAEWGAVKSHLEYRLLRLSRP
jgi:N-acetyltransferase